MIRALDIVISSVALFCLAPLLMLTAAIVYFADPGPILFGQRRIGRGGKMFRCLKFRSMVMDAEARLTKILAESPEARAEWALDQKLKVDPRITPIGRFLRMSSIDELPQLWNVLRGDMSIVGPRPIVEAEAVRYGRYIVNYSSVRPGITGLWQVSGRNNVCYRRRVALDVAYARSQSLGLNVKILLMTVPSVLMARGSY
ncbi:sugar transferase [Sphingomonas immobilis]|uniref:Sugar transferase n=1 Tax=Sphingomonas immobilis TaxID=3063997 RepID=A0ABT9A456_9SPHN|nr:sugar transferase [Sphingomonas sp. CA1-15]MDO7844628.1 sugar transferase [Sphingomonas sp. CA1-15]